VKSNSIGEILVDGLERSKRNVVIRKIDQAYHMFRDLITFHLGNLIRINLNQKEENTLSDMWDSQYDPDLYLKWINVGGQLIPSSAVDELIEDINEENLSSWENVHEFYHTVAEENQYHKFMQARAVFQKVFDIRLEEDSKEIQNILKESIRIKETLTEAIRSSRTKDYENPFRKIVYSSQEEMEKVIGRLEDNEFIRESEEELRSYRDEVNNILQNWEAVKVTT